MEGDDGALERLQEVFALLPNRFVQIATEAKAKYHAAASIASNHVTGLIFFAVELLKEAGIREETAYEMLEPLVMNGIREVFSNGCAAALTGPIERGDTSTVKHHLEALKQPEWQNAYRGVGALVLELAQKKHPSREYKDLAGVLKPCEKPGEGGSC